MGRFMRATTLVAFLFIGVLIGSAVMHFGGPLADYLRNAYTILDPTPEAGDVDTRDVTPVVGSTSAGSKTSRYSYNQRKGMLYLGVLNPETEDGLSPPVPDESAGVRFYDPERALNGYTIYAPIFKNLPIHMVDMLGNTVHKWPLPPEIGGLPRLDGVEYPQEIVPTQTDFHLYADGRLLVLMGNGLGKLPYGYGMAMLDKHGAIIWHYMKETHHQLDVSKDGRIATLLNRLVEETVPQADQLRVPFLDEQIALLSPDGEELAVYSVMEAMLGTPWESILKFVDPDMPGGDIFHINTVKFIAEQQAGLLPAVKAGDLLLGFRNINMIAALNPESGKLVWATRGPWHMLHDPVLLDSGNLLVFDNHGDMARGGRSRILELQPATGEIVWEWPGLQGYDLYSSIGGSVERLANGNTLVSETNRGRIIEVAPNGDVVWDFEVPERTGFWGKYIMARAWHSQRVYPVDLTFLADD